MGKARRKERDVTSSSSSQEESKQYLQATMLECAAPEYKLRELVVLPEGVDYNEWLASHLIAFFDHINLIYGVISEFCTISGCPEMTGPGNRQYLWLDEKGKRCRVSSPQYIDYVMTYTQKTVNDESVFPTKFEKEFPSSFESAASRILRLLFHVLAHIYHTHFKEIVLLNLHSHLNCIFAHLVMFNDRFRLVEEKEFEVLQDLAYALKLYPNKEDSVPETPVTPEPSGAILPLAMESEPFVSERRNEVITTQCRSVSPFINDACGSKDMAGDKPQPKEESEFKRAKCEKNEANVFSSDEVPLKENKPVDATNCIFSEKSSKDYSLSKYCNRRCTSASAVLFSCSSEPKMSVKASRRSNSSGTGYHPSLAGGTIYGLDATPLFASSSVTESSALKFQQ